MKILTPDKKVAAPSIEDMVGLAESFKEDKIRKDLAEREALAKESLFFFMTDACWTLYIDKDVDIDDELGRWERYPNVYYADRPDYWEHMHIILDVWLKEQYVMYPKSRQMLMSWTMVIAYLWQALTGRDEIIFFQSDKEDKAGFAIPNQSLLARAEAVYKRLPYNFGVGIVKKSLKPPMIAFNNGSVIFAINQKSRDPQSYSTSGILADEVAHQPYAGEAFGTAQPTLGKRGRYTGLSSVNGHDPFFYTKCHDLDRLPIPKQMSTDLQVAGKYPHHEGIMIWENTNGFVVCQYHEDADPNKRSDEWKEQKRKGIDPLQAAQEYDIDWDVYRGQSFFQAFKEEQHILRKDIGPIEGLPILRSWDFGYQFPALTFSQLYNGSLIILREFHEPDMETHEFIQKGVGVSYAEFDGFEFRDCCDANGTQRTKEQTDVEIMQMYHLNPTFVWVRNDSYAWAQLKKYLLAFMGARPGFMVNPSCKIVCEGLRGEMRYPMYKEGTRPSDDPVEKHPYIDIFDTIKYTALNFGGGIIDPGLGSPHGEGKGWGQVVPTEAPRGYMSM